MKVEFTKNNLHGINATKKTEQIIYKNNQYTYVGKSREKSSIKTRILALGQCILLGVAACFVVPCFSKKFRKTFKYAGSELRSGEQIVKHYVQNVNVFSAPKQPKLTSQDHFNKGVQDANDNPDAFD